MAPVSQIQHQPHQLQPDKPRRQFTQLNMSLFQALQRLLRLNLITLRAHPRNPNTASPAYDPNKRCAYHSASPGHDTNECWDLRNKIQDLIDEGVLEFTQDGQAEFFYHSSKAHQLKWQTPRLGNFFVHSNVQAVFFSFDRSNIYSLLKHCYFINASLMSILNQYIRIHYTQIIFIFVLMSTLSINNSKPLEGGWRKWYHNLQYAFEQTQLMRYRHCFNS